MQKPPLLLISILAVLFTAALCLLSGVVSLPPVVKDAAWPLIVLCVLALVFFEVWKSYPAFSPSRRAILTSIGGLLMGGVAVWSLIELSSSTGASGSPPASLPTSTANSTPEPPTPVPTSTPNPTPTPTTHIVGYWKFSDGAGSQVSDSSGHDNKGTIFGAEWSPNPPPVTGSTYSLYFNGNGGLVSIPYSADLSFSAPDPLTISLWFNLSPSVTSESTWHAIGKREGCYSDLTAINYQLAFDPSNGLLFDSDGNIVGTGPNTNVPTGVWTHFAATYDPDSQSLVVYLNGSIVKSESDYMLSAENAAELLIAASGSCSYTFAGYIGEVCIFRQTLSESQIKDLASGLPCNEVS
jgi:hypothetical protein